jgi:glycerophosphoryl diester phosphodiesterase
MGHPYFDLPTPLVIGHRGCAGEVPENTLESFARGLACSAVILESDLHLTRDGVPVLLHDPDVDRVTEGSGRVSDLCLEELQRLDAGHLFSTDEGKSYPFRGQGLHIPTFEETLKSFPGVRFNIELKDPAPGCVQAALEVILRNGREDLTLLTAGDSDLMVHLREQVEAKSAQVALGASVADIVEVLRSAQEHRPPATAAMALQIPTEFGGSPLVTTELVDHAHTFGIQVHVWTINDVDEMADLLALGVDGIVTDHPARLAELVGRS